MKMINTVLFDFDGTLINTNKVILASWQHTYEHYLGHQVDEEHILKSFGEPLRKTMEREFPGVDPDESMDVYRKFQAQCSDSLVEGFPGIAPLLKELRRRHFKLAIVTSRTRESTDRYLDKFGLRGMFNEVVSCDDTDAHKPDPEPILLMLEKLGLYRDQVIMVGDSAFDIKCANNAEVESVMVGWSAITEAPEEIGDYEADFYIEKPEELLDLLEDLNNFEDPSNYDRD